MKLREINERPEWTFWVPDSIAAWDAPSGWERPRLASMQQHLKPGDVLYDVGTEHGWLSAVYGSFCGYENMVLIEPSPEFWPNIRMTWQANGFPGPIACYPAFAGTEVRGNPDGKVWPDCADSDVEVGGMAYRYIDKHLDIPSVTIDWVALHCGQIPNAITVDVEGAEFLVMKGAEYELHNHRPLVWISIHDDLMERDFGHTPDELIEYMVEHCGYIHKHINVDHESHDLFVPEERA
jgi:FkbM family methyltransferase